MALREAQEDVIKALDELKTAVAAAGDSTSYRFLRDQPQPHLRVNSEVSALDSKMRVLERSAGLVYMPFRASLYEYAAEHRAVGASQELGTA